MPKRKKVHSINVCILLKAALAVGLLVCTQTDKDVFPVICRNVAEHPSLHLRVRDIYLSTISWVFS